MGDFVEGKRFVRVGRKDSSRTVYRVSLDLLAFETKRAEKDKNESRFTSFRDLFLVKLVNLVPILKFSALTIIKLEKVVPMRRS